MDDRIRKEFVRLPLETRPPSDLGDQWTVETLAEVFGVSASFVSLVWQEAELDPRQHLEQVERSPNRTVPLRVDLRVSAWFRLHLELLCREREESLGYHILGLLKGPDDSWAEFREDVLPSLRRRWTDQNEKLPRVDPRHWEYRKNLGGTG